MSEKLKNTKTIKISFIIPLYNEEKNVGHLVDELLCFTIIEKDKIEYIFIDDGSYDNTFQEIQKHAKRLHTTNIVRHYRNLGKTASLQSGIKNAVGTFIIFTDGNLQIDIKDAEKILNALCEKKVCNGWRKNRWNTQILSRKIPSIAANFLIQKISAIALHDFSSPLAVYETRLLKNIKLYRGSHRFLPALINTDKKNICEMKINFRQRKYGSSKFGMSRIFSVFFDIMFIPLLKRLSNFTRVSYSLIFEYAIFFFLQILTFKIFFYLFLFSDHYTYTYLFLTILFLVIHLLSVAKLVSILFFYKKVKPLK